MANYGPIDEVADHNKAFTIYDFTTASYIAFDFAAGGAYAADALLNDYAKGAVQIFGYDQDGNTITVTQAGVSVPLDGTGSSFARRAHGDGLTCYFKYNLPDEQNQLYSFEARFSQTDGANQQSVFWNNNTLQ